MRRISPGTVTIGVMAILFGLVAAYVIRQSMDRKEVTVLPPPPPPPQGKRVVVATVNLVKNSMVGNKQVRVTYVPEDRELPENIFRYAPPVIGRYLKQTVKAGQAITDDMLMPIGEGLPGLDEEVPEGYRAMPLSVAIIFQMSFTGFVVPDPCISSGIDISWPDLSMFEIASSCLP